MEEEVLVARQLTKKIGGKTIVDHVDFTINRGEIVGLLGPNGAGKTTIIRMLTGLISRSDGKVTINYHDLDSQFTECMEEVGAIIENPEFYTYLSGWENLKQFARMSHKTITDETILRIVGQVKLTEAIHNKVKTYSLGMRQRLGIAQAILHHPALLILDEPLNGVDPKGMHDFRQLMQDIVEDGTSILISSHLLSEMEQVADKILIIENGKVTYKGDLSKQSVSMQEGLVQLSIETNEIGLLHQQINEMGLTIISCHETYIVIEIEKDQIPSFVNQGVHVGIPFYGLTPHQPTLEERFLALTEGRKSK